MIFPHNSTGSGGWGHEILGQLTEILPTTLSTHDFMPEWYITKWWCSNLSFLLCFSWYITIRKGSPHEYSLSFISMLKCTSQYWPVGTHSVWFLLTFSQGFMILEHFLTYCPHKMFCVYFALSLPQPWNQLFLQGVLIPFSGM